MGTGTFNARGNPVVDWHPTQGEDEILFVASCYRNRDKLRTDGPLGSYADLPRTQLSLLREDPCQSACSVKSV